MNKQREVVYGFRNEIIHADDVRERLMDIMEEVVIEKVRQYTTNDEDPHEWNRRALADWVNLNFPLGLPEDEIINIANKGQDLPVPGSLYDGLSAAQFAVARHIVQSVRELYELKVSFENPDSLKSIERYTILSAIDMLWKEHLYHMDSLRPVSALRAYGQRDPLIEYKVEAFKMFDELDGQHQIRDLPQHLPQCLQSDGFPSLLSQPAPAPQAAPAQPGSLNHERSRARFAPGGPRPPTHSHARDHLSTPPPRR
jgi:preprotein translocase subunit SecA